MPFCGATSEIDSDFISRFDVQPMIRYWAASPAEGKWPTGHSVAGTDQAENGHRRLELLVERPAPAGSGVAPQASAERKKLRRAGEKLTARRRRTLLRFRRILLRHTRRNMSQQFPIWCRPAVVAGQPVAVAHTEPGSHRRQQPHQPRRQIHLPISRPKMPTSTARHSASPGCWWMKSSCTIR